MARDADPRGGIEPPQPANKPPRRMLLGEKTVAVKTEAAKPSARNGQTAADFMAVISGDL